MHEVNELIALAMEARKKAYAPYSDFLVGCALESEDGTVYTGCNIENSAYTPSNCAERTAFFTAVSQGVRRFSKIAIVGGKRDHELDFCSPCGVCRQVMTEFCDDTFEIIMAKNEQDYKKMTLGEMLPFHFDQSNLED